MTSNPQTIPIERHRVAAHAAGHICCLGSYASIECRKTIPVPFSPLGLDGQALERKAKEHGFVRARGGWTWCCSAACHDAYDAGLPTRRSL